MKFKDIRTIFNLSDKKSLKKICLNFIRRIDDLEIENFCLKEKIEKQKEIFASQIVRERVRADANELRNEDLNRISLKLIEAVEKFIDLSGLNEQEGLKNEKNNSEAAETH